MIDIGETIHLQLKQSTLENEEYKCRLVDRLEDKLIIDYPINIVTKKPAPVYVGTEFFAWYVGKDKAVYSFHTKVEDKQGGNVPTLILHDPGDETYERIQRRNYVRVDTGVDVAVHSVEGLFEPFTSLSLDLSGGGIAIGKPLGVQIPSNCEVVVWLPLHMKSGEIHYVRSICRVIRIFKRKSEARERISLQFVSIHERDRQKIVRYCFEKQSLLHRKGR
ncbi:flagellar brake protein [Bacillus alkalicellulosilyticus]|uniref:flagellar brake protein n=1 Tax=Alkalihalobacterium alkalicellulosilyticum TaxID=1912214 RepID=UPI000997300C|nr:flagellar brake domain-containing protein [Bacillus alkalicellulosilyticus]